MVHLTIQIIISYIEIEKDGSCHLLLPNQFDKTKVASPTPPTQHVADIRMKKRVRKRLGHHNRKKWPLTTSLEVMASNQIANEKKDMEEQEEDLITLIEYCVKEVDHLHTRVAYYKSDLDESKKRLEEMQHKLAHLRS